jgi:hypothetical protein
MTLPATLLTPSKKEVNQFMTTLGSTHFAVFLRILRYVNSSYTKTMASEGELQFYDGIGVFLTFSFLAIVQVACWVT